MEVTAGGDLLIERSEAQQGLTAGFGDKLVDTGSLRLAEVQAIMTSLRKPHWAVFEGIFCASYRSTRKPQPEGQASQ